MSDVPTPSDRDDELLRQALATLDRAATPQIRPPGSDAARARARQRRRRHRLAAGALAALLVVPFALDASGIGFPPRVQAPADTFAPGLPGMRQAVSGPGVFEVAEMTSLDWNEANGSDGCPSGVVRVDGGGPEGRDPYVSVRSWLMQDVDGDKKYDVVALVDCIQPPQARIRSQMVALFAPESPGSYRMIAPVVLAGPDMPDRGLVDFWLLSDGRVLVQLGDSPSCCDRSTVVMTAQWRLYAFAGGEFIELPRSTVPIGGGSELVLQLDYPAHLTFAPSDELGVRTGSLAFTVTNRGSGSANIWVEVSFIGAEPSPGEAACDRRICTFDLGAISSGGSATRSLALRATVDPSGGDPVPVAFLSVGSYNKFGEFTHGVFWAETAPAER